MNAALRKAASTSSYRDALDKDGLTVSVNTPEDMKAFMAQEIAAWNKVVKGAGIKPD